MLRGRAGVAVVRLEGWQERFLRLGLLGRGGLLLLLGLLLAGGPARAVVVERVGVLEEVVFGRAGEVLVRLLVAPVVVVLPGRVVRVLVARRRVAAARQVQVVGVEGPRAGARGPPRCVVLEAGEETRHFLVLSIWWFGAGVDAWF